MKKFYLVLALSFLAAFLIFISSFVYLDSQNHRSYYYTVNLDGYDVGSIRIERFATADRIIYKSLSMVPFLTGLTESKTRMDLDRQYKPESYFREDSNNGIKEIFSIEAIGNKISFVSIAQSTFLCLNKMIPLRKNSFVFEEGSPVTYLPMIENYNFKRGKSQAFTAMIPTSAFLPPQRMFVTLTSINDEYLKIGPREVKTEHLLVKLRNYPQGSIWVAKSDRSLVQLEIAKMGLRIKRVLSQGRFETTDVALKPEGYLSRDVEFKSKNAELAGTLTVPKGEGKYPAVALVGGAGQQDRE